MSDNVYLGLVDDVSGLLEAARRSSARAVNVVMTATYWEIGRRIVEFEQGGRRRAEYGTELLRKLSGDLTRRFGRGFSPDNLEAMRRFYRAFPRSEISETVSRESRGADMKTLPPAEVWQTPSGGPGSVFPLPWSHYVLLLAKTRSREALAFYHAEALRGGWSVRQLDRQIATQFYERTALSKNKAAILTRGAEPRASDAVSADEEVKNSLVLEFLGLKDEYSESDLEEALVRHLEAFLMELGNDFAFIGRQRRLRVGNSWWRVDLLFFHRRLRCVVVIDLKLGAFTSGDAGRMNAYLNYAREHWTQPGENPPVGLLLALERNDAVVHYALEGLQNTVLAREYRLVLPDEKRLAEEIEATRKRWESSSGR